MRIRNFVVSIAVVLGCINLTACGTLQQTGKGFVEGAKQDLSGARNYVADVIRAD